MEYPPLREKKEIQPCFKTDFESTGYGWTQERGDGFDWMRTCGGRDGRIGERKTGPSKVIQEIVVIIMFTLKQYLQVTGSQLA
ncbi:uncharacterized protein [Antedon mediterranea]|uniref:uncharacterized protein isoform X2 n=1 Tax=Antedon mediterranea TaxID=105859 RepID=UPI003AF5D7A7